MDPLIRMQAEKVSIHARARRATGHPPFDPAGADGFNPRPRAAGDAARTFVSHRIEVSIHARARRATLSPGTAVRHWGVSIHARARRATCADAAGAAQRPVSIHARARRATLSAVILPATPKFQSTPARGGRHLLR